MFFVLAREIKYIGHKFCKLSEQHNKLKSLLCVTYPLPLFTIKLHVHFDILFFFVKNKSYCNFFMIDKAREK